MQGSVKFWFSGNAYQFLTFLWFQRVINCRIKPKNRFFFIFLEGFQSYFAGFLKFLCSSPSIEEIFNIKNWKQRSTTFFFLQIYQSSDLGNNIFTTWNVHKPEVYLTCINFWKFLDHLKACLEVIRLPSWPGNKKFEVKTIFYVFDPLKNQFLT